MAAAVLVGAAVYIGLDLRSANRTTAEREAADAARPGAESRSAAQRRGGLPGRLRRVAAAGDAGGLDEPAAPDRRAGDQGTTPPHGEAPLDKALAVIVVTMGARK
ncbi:hypothetical protein ACPPVO_23095 [Dactylosporangium sp. McL0621]|uniref:hypothetical protein n=1 Tax=Dactylosporangium sp. McL0621 TaxID=3415678 RepID=UPI003CE814A4